MFDHLFENRNSTVTNLLKLGDCLGRSLRENIELFSIDSEAGKVAYLSGGGKVLSGEYNFEDNIILSKIQVQESSIFSDNKIFDSFVEDKVTSFVGSLNADSYRDADKSFDEILELWENRLKFENVKSRLDEKTSLFSESQTIVNTEQFQRFLEIMPQFTEFLEEQRETIQEVQEIENAIKLSNSVSQAFDFPRITYKTLKESPEYHISKGINKSVYELICKQELVKKELLESKKNFEDVWATNAKIRNLATLVFENSDEKVMETLVEAIIEVPFLALTTKKQLFESIGNAFSLGDSIAISEKEIKTFVAKLFEMKKPVKQVIINLLNEKYGINVQNLKDTATFSSLSETQVVIFESLARLAPKGSIIKDTLSELSKMLKSKNGVEVIDVNDVLQECFETCGYDKFCEDFRLVENISFDVILEKEVDVVELIEKAKEKLLMDKAKRQADDDGLSSEQAKAKKEAEAAEDADTGDEDLEDDSIRAAESSDLDVKTGDADDGDMDDPKQVKKKKKLSPSQKELDADGDGDIEGDDLKDLRKGKKKVKEETEEPKEPEEPEENGEKNDSLSKEDFLDGLKDMEELLQGMSADTEEEEVDDAETDETEA
tara:strand:+ start:817 stop:2631 length:1815 start_codon:yes stop_codon:yes gene_type:complete